MEGLHATLSPMSYLSPTPPEKLVDGEGRPYFLWDTDMTLDEFRGALASGTPTRRARLLGRLLRQAKPDDAFLFVTPAELRREWDSFEAYLGRSREFWRWLLDQWEAQGVA